MSRMMSAERRSVNLVGSLIVLVLVILLGVWFALGERESGTASEGTEVLAQSDEDNDEDDADATELVTLTVTYDHFLARDPFESIRPPEPVSTDPDPSNGNGGTNDGNDGSSNDDAGNDDAGNDDDGVCRTGAEAVCDGRVVVLRGVEGGVASIEVNGVTYEVEPGGVFASDFQLIRIEGDCADILFLEGDEADLFTLCVGGTVAK